MLLRGRPRVAVPEWVTLGVVPEPGVPGDDTCTSGRLSPWRGAVSATRGAGVGGVLHGVEGHGGLLLAWISNRIDNAEDLRARRPYRRSMALRPTTAPYVGEKQRDYST